MLHDALLYDEMQDQKVRCQLCAHQCVIKPGSSGICRVRENVQGQLKTRVYGNLIAQHVDPIEKKPLYHFLPGSKAYSIATPGCNFRCDWCQNWQISQMPREMSMPSGDRISPESIVSEAIRLHCQSIAYTYTEPTIFFEYAFDTARLAREAGLKNIFVTNGFMSAAALEKISPYLDAANVDIKAFRDETYRSLMGGRLAPVLNSCRLMKSLDIWLEVTTLVVPGVNDDLEEIRQLAAYISDDLGKETPWHISRFFPQYKMRKALPTDSSILLQAQKLGRESGLDYVYMGNFHDENATHCKVCGQLLIQRSGHVTNRQGLDSDGSCTNCGTLLDGIISIQGD